MTVLISTIIERLTFTFTANGKRQTWLRISQNREQAEKEQSGMTPMVKTGNFA